MTFTPPTAEQRFVLETVADLPALARLPAFQAATPDVVNAILEQSGRLAAEVLEPLNAVGDRQGARLEEGRVTLPSGFAEAFARYRDGGWTGLAADPEWGGQGLPFTLACAVQEQVAAANMAFSLCPMLTQGAIEALQAHASDRQKERYLRPLVEGRWTATMCLTEPQAGSDVGALRTEAQPGGDGTWRLKGTKIYITWGEHELAPNIVHLVLARTPGAPSGTRGLSLFLVPKFLPDAVGQPGRRNDLGATALEHKLGLHASPTCTMVFGDGDACVAELVGEEGAGMRAMFTMMNHARINVGLQGVGVGERAVQLALAHARQRIQGAPFGEPRRAAVPIVQHADVRRLLLTARALVEAARAIAFLNAAAVDRARAEPEAAARAEAKGLADLLTPVTKAFGTDVGVEAAGLAIQVLGGMGYIEEAGAARLWRDARIAPIYEGTNGIQAMDLVGRKIPAEGGRHWRALFERERRWLKTLPESWGLKGLQPWLEDALEALQTASVWVLGNAPDRLRDTAAAATPYLRLFGLTLGGTLLARQAAEAARRLEAGDGDPRFLKGRIALARFYAEQILPAAPALLGPVTRGAEALDRAAEELLAA
ncbi:MAG: acyl-CoA dehydrogenase [Sphingomonadaceae bacterium]|uniref:acyl-CoA dehydrogenase n=1 Tax=Thermaurantiacus sp. TaxID=2820283 RepID=UPI00298F0D1C|nr:acyl-CoA dehydrogenase [Thermaurantiacus sp.]MCS6986768.1 acyl-CoA dehydrogenase [Sphingomonadaceae bacterium]MDW8413969.1 acyl-CoA dehydrogenase [Thermaurantiacus sp.]